MSSLIANFFPPNLSPSYLSALIVPLLQTVGMAAGGMLVACVVGLPLAMLIGAQIRGARALYAVLSVVRAIPDLTLAILCVVVVGIGPAAGMLALAIFYTAMIGKVFADLFLAADWRPVEALRTTGATRMMVAFYGLLPITISNLVSMGCYSFECAVRAAVIVGAVGGGGLGAELVGTIAGFDYPRATTLILLLIVLVSLLDSLSWVLRRHPRAILLLLPFGVAALWTWRPETVTLRHAAETIGGMFPPALALSAISQLPRLLMETVFIASAGTLFAAVLALPLALIAARNLVPMPIATVTRVLLETLRAVPEVIWGLVLVTVIGVGPKAGVVALASGPMAIHTLFRMEWNLRAATVLGMIGAGGIGQALYNAQQLFFYDQMMAYVLITWAIVMLSDALSDWTRHRLGWTLVMA